MKNNIRFSRTKINSEFIRSFDDINTFSPRIQFDEHYPDENRTEKLKDVRIILCCYFKTDQLAVKRL